MKKLISALFILLFSLSASAQFRWGPTAGFNYSKYYFKQKLISVDASPGFSAGVMGELMFSGIGLGMDFGLNYEMHGSRLGLGEKLVWSADGYGTEQSTLHTIQIPVNLRYKFTNLNGMEQKIAPFAYGGPVFDIIAGHNKLEALEYSGGSVALQVGIGAEILKQFQVSAGYYWGMTYEVRTVKLDNFSARSQGWTVRLTYLLK